MTILHFTPEDGDAWLARNRNHLGRHDPVCAILSLTGVRPKRALEIGCANGWRLAKLRFRHGCEVAGIEPSPDAVAEAHTGGLTTVYLGTAISLPFGDGAFDLVIYGFCLYLCDPAEHFRIVAEGDRVLADGGHIVVHDFGPDGRVFSMPFKRKYAHRDGLWSHHMNFSRMWDAHPSYKIAKRTVDGEESVTLLRKDVDAGFPVRA